MEIRKFDIIDDKTNNKVVHEFTLGKANGFAIEPLDANTQSEIFTFNALGIGFADNMIFGWQISGISPPVISIENSNAERFKENFQFLEYIIVASAESVCENDTGFVVYS